METHLKMLCDGLNAQIDLTVLVSGDRPRTSRDLVDGVRVIRAGRLGRFSAAPICPSLPWLVRQIPADIIHIHVPHPTAIMTWLAAGRGTPLVVTYHSDTVRQRVLGKLFEPFLDRALSQAAAIICTSPQYLTVQNHCRATGSAAPSSLWPLKPMIWFLRIPAAVADLRERYGLRLLLTIGRLVYYKGFEHLIRAMPNITGHLLIIGQGPLLNSLEALARRARSRR